jgi:tetratricopeptide (TPR) repeat protein
MSVATLNSPSPEGSAPASALVCTPPLPSCLDEVKGTWPCTSLGLEARGQSECNTKSPPRNIAWQRFRPVVMARAFGLRRSPAFPQGWLQIPLCIALATGIQLLTQVAQCQSIASSELTNALALAQQSHEKAITDFKQHPDDLDAAVQAGRACFELAEFAEKKAERAKLAEEGMRASRQAVALQSNSAPAHYYLAMNLGQLMRSKGWGGIRYLGQLRREFEAAAALDPKTDFAGPERNLGYLFRDTPGFVGGDRQAAQKHLERAVQISPDFPENRLGLAEGLAKWDETAAARKQVEELEKIWAQARERFSGPHYAPAWADWEGRLRELKAKLRQ